MTLDKYKESLEIYHNLLPIYKEFYGEDNFNCYKIYQNISNPYFILGDIQKSLDFKLKCY